MNWTDVVGLLSNMPSLSVITRNIRDATNNAIDTYNAAALRLWTGKLRSLRDDVINVNAIKLQNLQDMEDYLTKKPYPKTWTELQANWSVIPIKILALSLEISIGNDAKVTTMTAAISIKDILSRQAALYTALSTTPEPQKNTTEWEDFNITYERLHDMYAQVSSLENAIDEYLRKHNT
jgi:hypothetical protein